MVKKRPKQARLPMPMKRRRTVSAEENVYRQGLAKHRQGDLDGAEFVYRNILDKNPGHVGALHYLGIISHARGRSEEALKYIEKSILLGHGSAVFYSNYGAVLMAEKREREAAIAFGKALEIDPKFDDARKNLIMLRKSDIGPRAPVSPAPEPAKPETSEQRIGKLLQQGSQFFAQEQFVDANRVFHEAASMPGGREIWRWKSLGFCPTVMENEQEIDRYWEKLDHGLDLAIQAGIRMDWRMLPMDGFTPSFNLPHHDKNCRPVKEKFARIFEKAFPQDRPDPKETRKDHTKIRIGFVVPPAHNTGFIRVNRGLLEQLDPQKFEICFFSGSGAHNECKKRVARNDINWIEFGSRFDETVRRIRDAHCDIVYHWKVGGGPLDYFLPFAKLAPIQCTSLGSHGTSGVGAVDHYISSKFLEGPNAQEHYTERLTLLDSYATVHEREPQVQATRETLGLPAEGALYFCPHRLAKYHPRFDNYLKRILEADPKGHVILLAGNRSDLAKHLIERLSGNLGDPLMKRLLLSTMVPHNRYRQYYSVVTCVLDSPVYAGDLTAHDAFDYDVPVVSQEGAYLVERYTSGLYRRMNMDSLIVDNEDQYVEQAVRLGTDADFNEEVRKRIATAKETIFEAGPVVKEYERFFESVVE